MPLQFSSLQFWSWSIDLLRKHRESYVWYCFFNLIMLENRAQMPKTLQIFSYGSVYSYSRMLYHPHGLCSAELRRTQRFISKCTVMNVFLEMLSYEDTDFALVLRVGVVTVSPHIFFISKCFQIKSSAIESIDIGLFKMSNESF